MRADQETVDKQDEKGRRQNASLRQTKSDFNFVRAKAVGLNVSFFASEEWFIELQKITADYIAFEIIRQTVGPNTIKAFFHVDNY